MYYFARFLFSIICKNNYPQIPVIANKWILITTKNGWQQLAKFETLRIKILKSILRNLADFFITKFYAFTLKKTSAGASCTDRIDHIRISLFFLNPDIKHGPYIDRQTKSAADWNLISQWREKSLNGTADYEVNKQVISLSTNLEFLLVKSLVFKTTTEN